MSLEGKVAIVTGGERGIGKGITRELLSRGMRVCIAGLDTESAHSVLAGLNGGDDLIFIETDVRSEPSVKAMVEQVIEKFGRLDAFVANAGLAAPGHTPVEELDLERWNNVIATNLTGVFLSAKYSFPHLRRTRGAMVLMASTRALQSEFGSTAYAASKGGVLALAHSLAITGGPEIRVNSISPGWINHGSNYPPKDRDHAIHPVGRVGLPEDIAHLTAFLISEEAGFITGQNFVADGGMSVKMIYA